MAIGATRRACVIRAKAASQGRHALPRRYFRGGDSEVPAARPPCSAPLRMASAIGPIDMARARRWPACLCPLVNCHARAASAGQGVRHGRSPAWRQPRSPARPRLCVAHGKAAAPARERECGGGGAIRQIGVTGYGGYRGPRIVRSGGGAAVARVLLHISAPQEPGCRVCGGPAQLFMGGARPGERGTRVSAPAARRRGERSAEEQIPAHAGTAR
jgi:hypothetical protein